MRNFFIFFSVILCAQTLLAFDPETPPEVATFVQLSEAKEQFYDPIAAEPGFNDLNQGEKIEKFAKVVPEPERVFELLEQLTALTQKVVSDEYLLMCVPYGCRRFLPTQYRAISFKELKPFDFSASREPILAVGGTAEESVLLASDFDIDPLRYCSINVLHYTKPNFLGDVVKPEHVAQFEGKFAFAFARAVPFTKEHLPMALVNIATSLRDDGIFVGEIFGDHGDEQTLEKNLLAANFKSFLILGHKSFGHNAGVFFVASREAISPEAIARKIERDETLRALSSYVTTELRASLAN